MKVIKEAHSLTHIEVMELPYFGKVTLTDTKFYNDFQHSTDGVHPQVLWKIQYHNPRFKHLNFHIYENGDMSIRAYFHHIIWVAVNVKHIDKSLDPGDYTLDHYHYVLIGTYWTPFFTIAGYNDRIKNFTDVFRVIRDKYNNYPHNFILKKNGVLVAHLPQWVSRVGDDGARIPEQKYRKTMENFDTWEMYDNEKPRSLVYPGK